MEGCLTSDLELRVADLVLVMRTPSATCLDSGSIFVVGFLFFFNVNGLDINLYKFDLPEMMSHFGLCFPLPF